jgi:hypothetical protein
VVEKTLSEKCRDGEGSSPIDPFGLDLPKIEIPPEFVDKDLFQDLWSGRDLRDLFEGDTIIQTEFTFPLVKRFAFGPIAGPVLLTKYGHKRIGGLLEIFYRVAIAFTQDISLPIFIVGLPIVSRRLGYIDNGTGQNMYPTFRAHDFGEDYVEMVYDINRVIRSSRFYILMEIERTGAPPDREVSHFLEIRYLSRPIKEIANLLKLS